MVGLTSKRANSPSVTERFTIPKYLLSILIFLSFGLSYPLAGATGCGELDQGAEQMVWLAGGEFVMGNDNGHRDMDTGNAHDYPEERFEHRVSVPGFWMDRHEVTNRQFARFVEATGYVTLAERQPPPEWFPPGYPIALMLPASAVFVMPENGAASVISDWWQLTPGANWRRPEGPGSSIENRMLHPVVHVAFEDAEAYTRWAGRELPTEAQWEYAARGGLDGATYTWGETFKKDGKLMANTWQGKFPLEHEVQDGFAGTAPVGCFPANGFGLYDMAGNVWEITRSGYQAQHVRAANAEVSNTAHVIKGGSFLCTPHYCMRYRPAARQAQEYTMSTSHVGFRTVKNQR